MAFELKTENELNDMSVPQLKALAHDMEIDIKGNLSQKTLVDRILDAQVDPDADFKMPEIELEMPEDVGEYLQESILLTDGSNVSRMQVVKATARDYGLSTQEWNELSDKDKEKKIKGFVSTLSVKDEEVIPEEQIKTPRGTEAHIRHVLQKWIEKGLNIEVVDNHWTMTYGNKAPISGNIGLSDGLLEREARKMVYA